jgi:ribose 5-phosphate isomerase A
LAFRALQPISGVSALKKAAAERAVEEVRSGMAVGLGTGSTVAHFLTALAERLRDGTVTGIVGVPTSVRTAEAANELGIPLTELAKQPVLDVTVDGADEVDPRLDLIKGLGGALLREKIVARASKRLVIIADESKRVDRLGARSPLPVEVVRFAWELHLPFLRALGSDPRLRRTADGEPYLTDNGNYVVDCHFAAGIDDVASVEAELQRQVGVVESGLFLDMAARAVIGSDAGVYVMDREDQ